MQATAAQPVAALTGHAGCHSVTPRPRGFWQVSSESPNPGLSKSGRNSSPSREFATGFFFVSASTVNRLPRARCRFFYAEGPIVKLPSFASFLSFAYDSYTLTGEDS